MYVRAQSWALLGAAMSEVRAPIALGKWETSLRFQSAHRASGIAGLDQGQVCTRMGSWS